MFFHTPAEMGRTGEEEAQGSLLIQNMKAKNSPRESLGQKWKLAVSKENQILIKLSFPEKKQRWSPWQKEALGSPEGKLRVAGPSQDQHTLPFPSKVFPPLSEQYTTNI